MYKRGNIWWFKVKGVPYSSGTSDEARAKREEARVRLQIWERERFGVKISRSWVECVAEWAKRKSKKASWKDDQTKLRWWDQWLGPVLDVRTITRAQIDKVMREQRGATASSPSSQNATANRYVAVVSGILNMAKDELEWIETTPKFIHYPETTGKEDWITPQQWIRLSESLPPHLLGPAQFSLATGLRQAKVMTLRWDQIDWEGRWMSFSGTANKLGNVIPLNDTAMAALQMAREAKVVHATYVWLYRGVPFRKPKAGWYNALVEAGLGHYENEAAGKETDSGTVWSGFTWHGLRHTCNSWLAQAGVPEDVRKRLCGWSSATRGRGGIASRYTHYDLDHLRPYAAVIDKVLGTFPGQQGSRDSRNSA